jgi:hypothetical protein
MTGNAAGGGLIEAADWGRSWWAILLKRCYLGRRSRKAEGLLEPPGTASGVKSVSVGMWHWVIESLSG